MAVMVIMRMVGWLVGWLFAAEAGGIFKKRAGDVCFLSEMRSAGGILKPSS